LLETDNDRVELQIAERVQDTPSDAIDEDKERVINYSGGGLSVSLFKENSGSESMTS
jgi:hypothetical protein